MSEIAISPTAQMKFILSSTANDAATNQFYNLMHSKTWGEGGGGGIICPSPCSKGEYRLDLHAQIILNYPGNLVLGQRYRLSFASTSVRARSG